MKQELIQTQKLKPELKLTVGVQLFLKLIQMPIAEVHEYIEQQLQNNPVLEIDYTTTDRVPQDSTSPQENNQTDEEFISSLFTPYLEENVNYSLAEKDTNSNRFQIAYKNNWKEQLFKQLIPLLPANCQAELLKELIENLSDTGLFLIPIEEIAANICVSKEKIFSLLSIIQDYAIPAGIGARNIKECILIQLKRMYGKDHFTYKIVHDHFIDLIHKKYKKISKQTNIPLKQIEFTKDVLKNLYLSPPIPTESQQDIIPEYEVKIIDGQIVIEETSFRLPQLYINKHYLAIAKTTKDKKTKEFLKNYITQAKNVIEAIHQRKEKLKKMVEFLCEYQREFVENGPAFLKPLTLKEVASVCNLSESTISRLSQRKYIQLPWGCIKLKDFFLHPLSHTGEIGKGEIILRIKEIIETTPKISDEKIRKILQEEGISISRRTINKYRNLYIKTKK